MSFIVLEGIDFVGKSTQANLIAKQIKALKFASPHGIMNKMRVMFDKQKPEIKFIFYLMANIHLGLKIKKVLKKGHVVCDRFVLSTLAYHNALGVNVKMVNIKKLPLPKPDITIYLHLESTEEYVCRAIKRGQLSREDDLIIKNLEFRAKIHDYYQQCSIDQINTDGKNIEKVFAEIIKKIAPYV